MKTKSDLKAGGVRLSQADMTPRPSARTLLHCLLHHLFLLLFDHVLSSTKSARPTPHTNSRHRSLYCRDNLNRSRGRHAHAGATPASERRNTPGPGHLR